MKKLLIFLVAVLFTANLFSQVPEKLSYQAVIRNAGNKIVANSNIGMQISILRTSASGTAVYVERHFPTTNENGLVTIEIGNGTTVSGSFGTIDWSSDTYYIKTETDLNGGANYTITGTSQILSVPYALHAKTAEKITGNVFTHYIGELYGGGLIFYIEPMKDSLNEEHGLIVSTEDVGWADFQSLFFFHGSTSMWNGLENTNYIITHADVPVQGADLCVNYRGGGFSDWYLPSIREFQLLWRNCFEIMMALNLEDIHPYFGSNYWSSSISFYMGIKSAPWILSFETGTIYLFSEWGNESLSPVRAVRRF
jgi:hypothetical protein